MSNWPYVDAEARVFIGLVKQGVCTVEQARSDIGVSHRQKAWYRQNFKRDSDSASYAWSFRAQVLERFDQLITGA